MSQERMDHIAENPEEKKILPPDPYAEGKSQVDFSETVPLDQNDSQQTTERLAKALYASAK